MAEQTYDDSTQALYAGVKRIIEAGGIKTFSFDDIKWTVDRAKDYANLIGQNLVNTIQKDTGKTDGDRIKITKTIYKLKDLEQSLQEIKKTETIKEDKKTTIPPLLKNIDPMSGYSNCANGYNYKAGFAGDFPSYDPTQAKLPGEAQQPSALSDHAFGRIGKTLPAGVSYNTGLKNLHSSEQFHLGRFSDAEINHTMFTTQNRTFQTTTLKKIQITIEELSPFMVINWSWRWSGANKLERRWKKAFGKPVYYLSDENQREKKEFLQNLLLQEANHYLTRIEKNTNQDQLKSHLLRYNSGDSKGVLEPDRRYTLKLSDFNAQAKKKIKPDLETEKILQYIDNPALVEAEITQTQNETQLLKLNPFEVGINNALGRIDDIIDKEITIMQGPEAHTQEKKAIEKIKKEILIHTQTLKEFSPLRYLTPIFNDDYGIDFGGDGFMFFDEFKEEGPGEASSYLGNRYTKDEFSPLTVAIGKQILKNYNTFYPNWDKKGVIQAFVNLYNIESSAFFDELDKVKEKTQLYKAQSDETKLKAILEYIKQIREQRAQREKEAQAKNAKT